MKTRIGRRTADRQTENAALCKLPLTEYLALPRRERRRRIRRALALLDARFRSEP